MGPFNQRPANHSIFSFSGSEHLKPGKTGDFPYHSTGYMMTQEKFAYRSIENEQYSHFSKAVESIKSQEELKKIK